MPFQGRSLGWFQAKGVLRRTNSVPGMAVEFHDEVRLRLYWVHSHPVVMLTDNLGSCLTGLELARSQCLIVVMCTLLIRSPHRSVVGYALTAMAIN
jgi:hypothetical protein